MSSFVDFLLYDPQTGEIRQWGNCAKDMIDAQARDGLVVRIHNKGDGIANFRVSESGQLIRKGKDEGDIETERRSALAAVDAHYALILQPGPFADIHRTKLMQAEAGGGSLISDEQDRLAILAKAKEQDLHVATIEAERRAAKGRVRDAVNISAIRAAIKNLSTQG